MYSNSIEFFKQLEKYLPNLLVFIGVLEAVILVICWAQSWDQSYVAVIDPRGEIVYETQFTTTGNQLNKAKEIIRINSQDDDSLAAQYQLVSKHIPRDFPVRAWISASIAVPLAVILFCVFLFRIYTEVLHGGEKNSLEMREERRDLSDRRSGFDGNLLENAVNTFSRLGIIALGGLVFIIALLFWLIPDVLTNIGLISADIFLKHQWLAGLCLAFLAIMLIIRWIIKYRISMEVIRQQGEIQRRRDELAVELKTHGALTLKEPEEDPGLLGSDRNEAGK